MPKNVTILMHFESDRWMVDYSTTAIMAFADADEAQRVCDALNGLIEEYQSAERNRSFTNASRTELKKTLEKTGRELFPSFLLYRQGDGLQSFSLTTLPVE